MYRTLIFLIITLAVFTLGAPSASAQVPGFSPEYIRMRMEQSVARQRLAIQRIAESIATQKRALTQQRGAAVASDFFQPYVPKSRKALMPVPSQDCSTLAPEEIDSLIDNAAANSDVDPEVIRAVMRQESAFQPCAVSSQGARGLMQLMPGTASDLGVRNVFDPEENVLGGAKFLHQLIDRYGGDLRLALSAYNAGPGRVDKVMDVPPILETRNYVNRIMGKLSGNSKAVRAAKIPDFQNSRDKAPSTIFWLMGNEAGK